MPLAELWELGAVCSLGSDASGALFERYGYKCVRLRPALRGSLPEQQRQQRDKRRADKHAHRKDDEKETERERETLRERT